MAKVKILLDPIGNVMNIWWGDPKQAYKSEEVDDPTRNDVVVKDKRGNPISLEIIGIFPKELNVAEMAKRLGNGKKKVPFLLHS